MVQWVSKLQICITKLKPIHFDHHFLFLNWNFDRKINLFFFLLIHGSFLILGRCTYVHIFSGARKKKVSSRRLMSQSINPFFVDLLQIVQGVPAFCNFWFQRVSNHEMRGSRILRTVFSIKPQNGTKSVLKSTFWAFFPVLKLHFQVYSYMLFEFLVIVRSN